MLKYDRISSYIVCAGAADHLCPSTNLAGGQLVTALTRVELLRSIKVTRLMPDLACQKPFER